MSDGLIAVLEEISCSLLLSCIYVFFRWLLLLITFIDFELLNLQPNFFKIIKIFYYICPYKIRFHFSQSTFIILLTLSSTINISIFFGFYFSSKIKHKKMLKLFGIFVYWYIYFGGYFIIGNTAYFLIAENDISSIPFLLFKILSYFTITITFVFLILLEIFYKNTFLCQTDMLTGNIDYNFIPSLFMFVIIIIIDSAFDINGQKYKWVFILLIIGFQLYMFLLKITYDHFNVCMFNFLMLVLVLYISILFTITTQGNFINLQQSFFIFTGVGIFFILVNFCLLWKYLLNSILRLDYSILKNPSYLDKQIKYLLKLIKTSKSAEIDELQLITYIFQHELICKTSKCVCKNRAKAWDPKKIQFSTGNQTPWKDNIFLNNLGFAVIEFYRNKNPFSTISDFLSILYSLEIIENTVRTSLEINLFKKKHKSFWASLIFKIPIERVDRKTKVIVNRKADNFLFACNQFQNVIKFDINIKKVKFFKKMFNR